MVGFQSELYKDRSITASKDIVQSIEHPIKHSRKTLKILEVMVIGLLQGFGRLNYDYMGKYLAEVNLRYDGTSRF